MNKLTILTNIRRWVLMLPLTVFLATGCGIFIDMAHDNEWRWATFSDGFVSPIELRVGVLPFVDGVGLGGAGVGYNMAELMTKELAKDSNLIMVPVAEVEAAMQNLGFSGLLNPKQAAEVGLALGLNAVVIGSISEIKKYALRTGWRRAARIFTDQQTYVDAVLAVSAVDSTTGIVLVSRANVGQFDGGTFESDPLATGNTVNIPSQEALEASLDEALEESYYRTRAGLATLPFKAMVVYSGDGEATIPFGQNVELPRGAKFSKLEIVSTVTNTIGESYQVMGASLADLEVEQVNESSSSLKVLEGYVYPGDIIQCMTGVD